jgi:hypothetical protein
VEATADKGRRVEFQQIIVHVEMVDYIVDEFPWKTTELDM